MSLEDRERSFSAREKEEQIHGGIDGIFGIEQIAYLEEYEVLKSLDFNSIDVFLTVIFGNLVLAGIVQWFGVSA